MFWRTIIAGLTCYLLAGPAAAVEKPYRVKLIGDAYDGTGWRTGVLIELEPGWKTYWRMPGEAGIPPDFAWKTSVPAEVALEFPVPARHADASGETVGYEREVIFPVAVKAGDAREVRLDLSLFFAVCKDICIPAQGEASIVLGSAVTDPGGSARVEDFARMVPAKGDIIGAADLLVEDNQPMLRLTLREPVDDIFVETPTSAYFRKPQFTKDGREARLRIDNAADLTKLRGTGLKLTYAIAGRGLEQTVILP